MQDCFVWKFCHILKVFLTHASGVLTLIWPSVQPASTLSNPSTKLLGERTNGHSIVKLNTLVGLSWVHLFMNVSERYLHRQRLSSMLVQRYLQMLQQVIIFVFCVIVRMNDCCLSRPKCNSQFRGDRRVHCLWPDGLGLAELLDVIRAFRQPAPVPKCRRGERQCWSVFDWTTLNFLELPARFFGTVPTWKRDFARL